VSRYADESGTSRTVQSNRYEKTNNHADEAGELWCDAEIKIGTELKKLPPAKGTRGQQLPPGPGRGKKGKTGGSILVPPVSDAPTLAELGLARKRAARCRKLAEQALEQAAGDAFLPACPCTSPAPAHPTTE
jgi:hypothetical protein